MSDYYTYAIDIWSVGCIFAELLNMMKENVENPYDRQPLFPGTSCYPLSPASGAQSSAPEAKKLKLQNDQLGKIFQVIGSPDNEESLKSFLSDKQIEDVKQFPKQDPIDLTELFPGTDPAGLELLKKMLKFNPNERISAIDAIKDSYFDDIRLPEQETSDDKDPINLDFDAKEEDELPMETLKQLILSEIMQVSHNAFDFTNDFAEELCEDY